MLNLKKRTLLPITLYIVVEMVDLCAFRHHAKENCIAQ